MCVTYTPLLFVRDEEKWRDYGMKRVILEIYDALAVSVRTDRPC